MIAAKFVLQELSPLLVTTARFAVAVPVLLWLAYRQDPTGLWPSLTRRWPTWLAFGLAGTVLSPNLTYRALSLTTVFNISLLNLATPTITALVAAVWLREYMTRRQWLGFAISASGLLLAISGGSLATLAAFRFHPGDLWMLASNCVWACYVVGSRREMRTTSPVAMSAYGALFGSLLLVPLALWELGARPPQQVSATTIVLVILVGLLVSVVALIWWNTGVARAGAGRAVIFGNLQPIFAAALAFLFLGETIRLYQVVAGIIVACGVWLTTTGPQPAPTSLPTPGPARRALT